MDSAACVYIYIYFHGEGKGRKGRRENVCGGGEKIIEQEDMNLKECIVKKEVKLC